MPQRDQQMQRLLDGPLKPGLGRANQPKRQNEITSDLQVFSGSVIEASVAAATRGLIRHHCYLDLPFCGMPAVDALVEVKAVTSKGIATKDYAKDVAKLALMGQYFHRRFKQPYPYLGAWILAIHEDARSEAGLHTFRHHLRRRLGEHRPGAERVRVVVFRPGEQREVL